MPRVFDRSKLKPDCSKCDSLCCVATALPYPDYPKPARVPCRHLDQAAHRCTIFATLEQRGYHVCREFDCLGAGVAVTQLFRKMGRTWQSDASAAAIEFHTFSLVYFALVKYVHPDRAMEIDVPAEAIKDLEPFTEAALDLLADSADPFANMGTG